MELQVPFLASDIRFVTPAVAPRTGVGKAVAFPERTCQVPCSCSPSPCFIMHTTLPRLPCHASLPCLMTSSFAVTPMCQVLSVPSHRRTLARAAPSKADAFRSLLKYLQTDSPV